MTDQTFEAFGLSEPLTRALKQCAYTMPTPIQVQALPPQLANRDMMALAETGSGKTAAFVLPILNHFATAPAEPNQREVLTLILAPTRELALQIDGEFASLSRNLRLRRAVVLGGVGKGPQIAALKRGVHVLVATPGRLLDLVGMRHVDLRSVRTLVLDEADRMFDMGFIRDIRKIASMLSMKRRTAMFSATMPDEIRKLANELLRDPTTIDISPKQLVVDRIEQKVMIVPAAQKQGRLHSILKDESCSRVIVFTRTKRGADRVADRLGMAGIGSAAIHGNKAQNARQRALADFGAGHVRVLVATDIAARGIDVSNVTHVINFDMPMEAETYVHRIGRTARKGASGIAISLCDPSERGEIRAIEKLTKQTIQLIADVGGDAAPLPDKRPHRTHAPERREGAKHQHARGGDDRRKTEAGGKSRRQDDRRPAHAAHSDRNGPRRDAADGARNAAPARQAPRQNGDNAADARSPRSWEGQRPPKFLNKRGPARGFNRPSRNPAA